MISIGRSAPTARCTMRVTISSFGVGPAVVGALENTRNSSSLLSEMMVRAHFGLTTQYFQAGAVSEMFAVERRRAEIGRVLRPP